MSAPSPKRQRLPSSFSPASPLYHLAAKGVADSAKPVTAQPQTPISPSNMSSSGPGNSNSTSPTHPSSFSPPLSGSASTHPSTQTSTTTALLTPASSVKGSSTSATDDEITRPDATSYSSAAPVVTQDIVMTDSDSHTRTDHDRENDHDVQMEDSQQLTERLDANSEPFYYVLEETHPPSAPHPSQDLIAMYGLKSIAASVARRDPTTGDKINKIRKSYEGKIKTLGISGRNKTTSKPGELSSLLQIPEDAWQAHEVSTRDVKKGMTASLESRLDRALKMNPGKLPPEEADKWKSMLAVDEPVKAKVGVDAKKTSTLPTASNPKATSPSGAHAEPSRPQRAGKKRRYDDSSFEGYAEGLNDEDGYSSPEEKLATMAAKKRRRKVSADEGPTVISGSGVGSETYKKKNLGLKLHLATKP